MNKKNHSVEIAGREVALKIRRHPRARHLILRIDDTGEGAIITIPTRATIGEALKMANDKASWILDGLNNHPKRTPFANGTAIPYRGLEHTICHNPRTIGITAKDGEILVGGKPEHLTRRLKDWLKKNARTEIMSLVMEKTNIINKKAGRVTLRDTRSRWGSCGPTGNLNFSWRLIMAPEYVLDYLVAHEVAHLTHHNHNKDFWELAKTLASDMTAAHSWLEEKGKTLHSYG